MTTPDTLLWQRRTTSLPAGTFPVHSAWSFGGGGGPGFWGGVREDTQFGTFLVRPLGNFTLATLFALPTLGQTAPSVASLLGYPFVSLPGMQLLASQAL